MKNSNVSSPVVCYIGVNEKGGKNSMTLKRLAQNGCTVVDVWVEQKVTNISEPKDVSYIASMRRLFHKLKLIPEIIRRTNTIRECDCLFVGYPGHFDIPLVWVVAKIFHKPLVFDQSTFLVDTLSDDVGVLKGTSLMAKILFVAEKIIYQLPDVILVDTEIIRDYLHTTFHVPLTHLHVLYLGADENVYRFSGYKKSEKTLNVLYYGLYNPIHGVEYIVKAARLLAKDSSIHFTFIGSGRTYPEIFNQVKSYGLKNIDFFQKMPEAEAQILLAKADIFLGFMQSTPSVDRFIPNKVSQGVALGKAVITANSKAIEHVFTHKKNIYLCNAADPKSLAQAIQFLKTNPELRSKLSRNGYQLFQKKLSMKAVGKHLVAILQKSIDQRRTGTGAPNH